MASLVLRMQGISCVRYVHMQAIKLKLFMYVLLQAYHYHLTDSTHAWILPGYYNPNWWKLPREQTTDDLVEIQCSDEDMLEILQSVIFVDSVKFPPLVH